MPPDNVSHRNIEGLDVDRSEKPKLVFLSGFYIGLQDQWPNLDKLSEEGIIFDSDYPYIGATRNRQILIEPCDLFLGIYGFERSGRIGERQQREYQLAREQGKPVLAFIHSGYLSNTPPIGVFDLLSAPQDSYTKVVSFGPHEMLEPRVFGEVRRFFANGARFEMNSRETVVPPEQTRQLEREKALQDAEDLRRKGLLNAAMVAYEQTALLFPDDIVARVGRAEVFKDMGNFEEALAAYDETVARFPDNLLARTGRAEVLKDIGHFEEALAAYDETVARFPDNLIARNGRAEVLKDMGHFEEALAAYDETVARFPDNLIARNGRAEVLKDMGHFEEALAAYDETVARFPDNLIARTGRAKALKDVGSFEEALAVYDETVARFPDNLLARIGRAEVLKDMGNFEGALAAYDETVAQFPHNLVARNGRAKVLRDMADAGEAPAADDDRGIRETSEITLASPGQAGFKTDLADEMNRPEPEDSEIIATETETQQKLPASQIDRVLELADQLKDKLGRRVIDAPMLLISLLDTPQDLTSDSLADRTAYAFLSSFNIDRKRLFEAESNNRRVVLRSRESPTLSRTPIRSIYTQGAEESLDSARRIALERNATEVQARDLFLALMSNSQTDDWIETTIGKEVVGWIGNTLQNWDNATPITQAAVQAKMVEDDLFVNPPTQRDSAAEKDLLGFEEYAEALVQIIRRPETRAPLVVGVYGPWGSGKSTFMGLVKRKLDALGQPSEIVPGGLSGFIKKQAKRFRGLFRKGERSLRVTTVDYDAWAYADAQKLWSGLVDKIAKELDAELTARDRIAYLINSHSRRLLLALALGLIPVALFALGYAAQHTSTWLSTLLSPVWNKPWLNLPGWAATAAWALYAYFLQKRPVTDAVASLASRFDSAPSAGLVSRIQGEFKTALQTRIDPEKKPKTVEALRTDIRQRVERNELKVVVFIDELDRCPLEKIVEILEAIKLFLAEDIFIVLLGVDTRVAAEAIRLHYKEVQNPNLPREYLEKIVQLPLRVPTARKQHIETYLQSFMTLPEDGSRQESEAVRLPEGVTAQPSSGANGDGETPAQVAVAEVTGNAGSAVVTVGAEENERVSRPAIVAAGTAPAENVAVEPAARTPYDASALSRSAALPQMPDTKIEFDAMAAIARDFLDSNPRRIKRLLNTYRYVKILAARLPGSQVQTARWQRTMLYWLAFTMKWPAFMSKAIEAAERPEAKDAPERFLHSRLKKGENETSQPQPERIEKYLSLTAAEVVEHYKLAPNFLIENPNLDPKTQADELTPPNELPPALPFLGF